nr:MAG TPA: tail assembly chaperone protein [Caudoviricetes sp.]
MYIIARYRLKFTEDEFWSATPLKLWTVIKSITAGTEKEKIEDATAANLFL